jgi:mevalonate kinase
LVSNIFLSGSKTFLAGEYAVLFGGSAVVLVTPPEFQLTIKEGKTERFGIDVGSPADLFYKSHDFGGISMKFCDPHNGSGGLGASSAQFATLYKLHLQLTGQKFNVESFLDEYKRLSCLNEGGVAPSGADCVAQYFNRHIFFNSQTQSTETINWNFPNLDFVVFKTEYKTPTYLHLQKLSPIRITELENAVLNIKKSFTDANEESLTYNVQIFFNLLKEKNLIMAQIALTVDRLLKIDGVKSAKGCGALGADAIIVIFEKSARSILLKKAQNLGLRQINI